MTSDGKIKTTTPVLQCSGFFKNLQPASRNPENPVCQGNVTNEAV
jgi:hypothetical protein